MTKEQGKIIRHLEVDFPGVYKIKFTGGGFPTLFESGKRLAFGCAAVSMKLRELGGHQYVSTQNRYYKKQAGL